MEPVVFSSGVLALVIGCISTFTGYRVFHFLIAAFGFVTSFVIGQEIMAVFSVQGTVAVVFAVALGIVGAFMAHRLFVLGLLLIGAFLGYSWSPALLTVFPNAHPLVIIIPVSLVFALLAMRLEKPVIILATTLAGSSLVLAGLGSIMTGRHLKTWYPDPSASTVTHFLILVLWAALVGSGLYCQSQFKSHKPLR